MEALEREKVAAIRGQQQVEQRTLLQQGKVADMETCLKEERGRNKKLTCRLDQTSDANTLLEHKRQEVELLKKQVEDLGSKGRHLRDVVDIQVEEKVSG